MNVIQSLDLKQSITKAVTDVFSMMLSMDAEPFDSNVSDAIIEGNKMVGSVSFTGKTTGLIAIHLTHEFASTIATTMLGVKRDELDEPDEIIDVIGEMANMIGGNLKSRLDDAGLRCSLSIPSITHGDDFQVDSLSKTTHEEFYFRHDQSVLMVDVYLNGDGSY